MEKTIRKPQIRVNRYPNGFWCIIYGKGGVLCANQAEGIAKLKEQYPGEYEIFQVNKIENINPRTAGTTPKDKEPMFVETVLDEAKSS